jgi:xylulokinase
VTQNTRVALGIDIGSTNTKAVLVALGADRVEPLATASAPTPNDADELVTRVLELVTTVLAESPLAPECVGIASMAESGVPLSDEDRPLSEILRWNGSRGRAQADALAVRHGASDLFAATGVQLGAKTPLATWLWLAQERPEIVDDMARWAGIADYVALAMTGRLVTDHTLAGRTMAYRLPAATGAPLLPSFDAGLLGLVGLTPERMPAILLPGDSWPTLSDERFVEAGLPLGIPVVVAGHDHAVGAHHAGLRAPGDTVDSLGTAEAVLMLVDRRPDLDLLFADGLGLVRTVGGAHEAVLAGSSSAGAMVASWRAQLGEHADSIVDRALAQLPDRSRHVVLPYLRGRQCPAPDAAARPGRSHLDDPVEATLAMFEGLAFQAAWMLDAISTVTERRPHRILIAGGAAVENTALMSMKAALSSAPLHRVDTPEPVAVGAAVIAWERSGSGASVPPASTTQITTTLPAGHYDDAYRRFVDAAVGTRKEGHSA